jgi:HSP20 family protein
MSNDDDRTSDDTSRGDRNRETKTSFDFEVGGLLEGLGDIVETLSDLADEGTVERSERFKAGDDDDVEGVWGFRVRTDIAGDGGEGGGIDVDSFGNMRSEDEGEEVVVEERREPMVDVYDEEEHVLITAEMPGVADEDVRIRLDGDVMTIAAEQGDKRYYKELVLDEVFEPEDVEVDSRNGIVRITCHK